jgi:pentatricopeptide repeat-containing protein PET309
VVLAFVDRALSVIEEKLSHGDNMRELVRWSVRLRRTIRQLGDAQNLPSYDSVHALCLLTRTEALLGRFDEVASRFPRIWDHRTQEEAYRLGHPELRMVETVLQALYHHRGAIAVLDFIVSEWDTLGRLVNMSPSWRHSRVPAKLNDIAFKIFDRIPSPVAVIANKRGKREWDVIRTGSLLIRYLIRRRVPEDALAVYKEMQRQSIDITPPLKLWLVRALAQGHAIEQANILFSEISASIPVGHGDELYLATALHLFSSQGDTTRSEAAFKALRDKNLAGSRAIGLRLLAYAHNGDVEAVLRYFHHHFLPSTDTAERPDVYHYTAVLMAHSKAGDSEGLNKWFGNMIADGVMPDRHVYNILLEDRARRGKLGDVAAIIKEMRVRHLSPLAETYTTVITALAKRGDPVAAEAYYKRALKEGVKPDRQMVASLMVAHSEVGSWKYVIRAFDYMVSSDDRHLRPRIDVYNILLKAYVLAGSPFEVVSDVFQKMEQSGVRPTAHTFSILIMSACDSGRMDVAMRVFMELDNLTQQWETGYRINVYALTILMAGYLRSGDRLKAKEIYDEMLFRGISPTSVTYGSILNAYAAEGRQESIQLACDFMKSLMESPDESRKWLSTSYSRFSGFENVYGPLMTMFGRKAKPEQVEELMDDMVRAGGKRTLTTLTLLLNAYRNVGNVNECRRVWDEILPTALRYFQSTGGLFDGGPPDPDLPRLDLQRKANIICVPLSIHMDALSAAGEHAEVADVWKTVRAHGFALDSHNWNHLIVALVRAGEIERAFQIVERVILPLSQQQQRRRVSPTVAPREAAAPRTPLSYDDDDVPAPHDPDTGGGTGGAVLAEARKTPSRASASRASAASAAAAAHLQLQQLAKENNNDRHNGVKMNFEIDSDDTTVADSPAAEAKSPDFAHSLHIMQQILPSWDVWQPHAAVVTVLMDALDQLEAGHMISPFSPRHFGDVASTEVRTTTWQGEESEASAARAVLERINASCPQAVSIVKEYEYRKRVRKELAVMVDEG